MAKASDNIFPLVRLAPGTAPAAPASGSTALFIDSADGALKTKDSAGAVKSVGGSGGSRDYRWFVPAGQTSIDEFNDDTLDPAWVRADGTGALAATATWTEKGDALSVYNAGGDSTGIVHAMLRPVGTALAVGDAFVTSLRAVGGNLTMGGLVLSDSAAFGSGTQVLAAVWDTGGGFNPVQGFAATNWGTFASQGSQLSSPGVAFVRLVMVAVGSWRVDVSPDGIAWVLGSSFPKTLTPTHVGLVSSTYGTGNKHVISYEFLRRVAGVS